MTQAFNFFKILTEHPVLVKNALNNKRHALNNNLVNLCILLSYFEKIAHMSMVWAYLIILFNSIFVALCVQISVVGANKVEGAMSWCIRTNEILASNMIFTRFKVKQGHFEAAILILHNSFVFCYHLRCLEA